MTPGQIIRRIARAMEGMRPERQDAFASWMKTMRTADGQKTPKRQSDPPSLSEALRDEIARQGLTAIELARQTGWERPLKGETRKQTADAIDPSVIARWLTGKRLSMSLETADRLAAVLGLVLVKRE